MVEAKVRLRNWSVHDGKELFGVPKICSQHLQGNVYDHPTISDGSFINTSRIVDIQDEDDHKEVTVYSRIIYLLYKEDINPEFEKQHPGFYDEKLQAFEKC